MAVRILVKFLFNSAETLILVCIVFCTPVYWCQWETIDFYTGGDQRVAIHSWGWNIKTKIVMMIQKI